MGNGILTAQASFWAAPLPPFCQAEIQSERRLLNQDPKRLPQRSSRQLGHEFQKGSDDIPQGLQVLEAASPAAKLDSNPETLETAMACARPVRVSVRRESKRFERRLPKFQTAVPQRSGFPQPALEKLAPHASGLQFSKAGLVFWAFPPRFWWTATRCRARRAGPGVIGGLPLEIHEVGSRQTAVRSALAAIF